MPQLPAALFAGTATLAFSLFGGTAWAGSVAGPPSPSYQTNGRVETIAISGTTAYIGGKFTAVRPPGSPPGNDLVARAHAAAIDLTTGRLLPWNPAPNGTVQTIAVDGGTVIMGGSFTRLGGRNAGRLVAVTASNGAVIWKVKPRGQVNDVVIRGEVVYAGGAFTAVGRAPRPYLASVNEVTGTLLANWRASADSPVTALALTPDETTIIVGGTFSSLDGVDVHRLGSVGAVSGDVTDWRPQFPPAVVSLGVDRNGVFVGGIGDGGNFASFDLGTSATRWLGGTDGNVQAVALYDGIVYVGGHFENYCGAAPGTHLCPTPTPRSKALAIGSLTGCCSHGTRWSTACWGSLRWPADPAISPWGETSPASVAASSRASRSFPCS